MNHVSSWKAKSSKNVWFWNLKRRKKLTIENFPIFSVCLYFIEFRQKKVNCKKKLNETLKIYWLFSQMERNATKLDKSAYLEYTLLANLFMEDVVYNLESTIKKKQDWAGKIRIVISIMWMVTLRKALTFPTVLSFFF